jgi:hypothetical protein
LEPARYLALKPSGFAFKVADLKDIDEDVKSRSAQIESEDRDPAVNKLFIWSAAGGVPSRAHAMFGS